MTPEALTTFVASLREFADFMEDKGLELPMEDYDLEFRVYTILYHDDVNDESAVAQMKRAAKALGRAEKHHGNHYFDLRREFGPITLEFSIPREKICERIVTGTREIAEHVIPAHTEEIVEWRCNDSLLAAADLA